MSNKKRTGKEIECPVCHNLKYRAKCDFDIKTCSRRCGALLRIGSGMLGKKHSEYTKQLLRTLGKNKKFSLETREKIRQSKLGNKNPNFKKTYSKERIKLIRENTTGNKNPNWKGGITSLSRIIRTSDKYVNWRNDILIRDKYTCQKCGIPKSGYLEVHHIVNMMFLIEKNKLLNMNDAYNCEELWNLNNGVTLCNICHIKNDKFRQRFETSDWNE